MPTTSKAVDPEPVESIERGERILLEHQPLDQAIGVAEAEPVRDDYGPGPREERRDRAKHLAREGRHMEEYKRRGALFASCGAS